MSFFAKGDYKIEASWKNKNQVEEKKPRKISMDLQSKQKESLLMNLGKNLVDPTPDILDEHISKKIVQDLRKNMPPSPNIPVGSKTNKQNRKSSNKMASEDTNLLTSMTTRLNQIQITCANQRKQINDQKEQMNKLKIENAFFKGMKQDSGSAYRQIEALRQKNAELEKKVSEMSAYLKQHGLKWVGNKLEGNLQHQKIKQQIKKGKNVYKLPSEIDINTIQRRIEELNEGLRSEGKSTEIYADGGIHKFRKTQDLPLGFFSNGIVIKGFNFYPYKSKESLQILGDLIDGYFPYVLKNKYPQGIFLKIVDKINQVYSNQSQSEHISDYNSSQKNEFKPPSKQEFLNKIPKQVIKNGKVIKIREQIQKRMDGAENHINKLPVSVIEEINGVIFFKTACRQKINSNKIQEQEICTLKIRTHEGSVCILQFERQTCMQQVYEWMNKILHFPYKLMGNFPRRVYQINEESNLEELGFFPNGMLHVQKE